MSDELIEVFADYEAELFGPGLLERGHPPTLRSELLRVSTYFAPRSSDDLAAFSSGDWADFAASLQSEPAGGELENHRCLKRLSACLEWAAERGRMEAGAAVLALAVLKSGLKELLRLERIRQHLEALRLSRVYCPGPTERPEDSAWLAAFAAAQESEVIARREGIYALKSKDRRRRLVFLEEEQHSGPLVLPVDARLASLLRSGDRLPLVLGETSDGGFVLLEPGLPMARVGPAEFPGDE